MDAVGTLFYISLVLFFAIWVFARQHRSSNPPETPSLSDISLPPPSVPVSLQPDHSRMTDFELLTLLRSLRPDEFEEFIAQLFQRLGYRAKVTTYHHDNGIDIIINKGDKEGYVQCKKYIEKRVTVGEIRDFYGAVADKLNQGEAFFVTTNIFTDEAKKFAEQQRKNGRIRLIDCRVLLSLLRTIEKKEGQVPIKTRDFSKLQPCPRCMGGHLVRRINKSNGSRFYGCSNFPDCRYTRVS